MSLEQRSARRLCKSQRQPHEVIDAVHRVVTAEIRELVHDPEHAAVRCLRETVLGHLRKLTRDERVADAMRPEHRCQRRRKPIDDGGRRSERHEHGKQRELIGEQRDLRFPEQCRRVPAAEGSRRLPCRRHGRLLHAIQELPGSVHDEHDSTVSQRGRIAEPDPGTRRRRGMDFGMETAGDCTESRRPRGREIASEQARRDRRIGDTGALSKTIVAQVTVGSNPTPSATSRRSHDTNHFDSAVRRQRPLDSGFTRRIVGAVSPRPRGEGGRCLRFSSPTAATPGAATSRGQDIGSALLPGPEGSSHERHPDHRHPSQARPPARRGRHRGGSREAARASRG